MGVLGAFKSIGKALAKGVVGTGRVLAKIDDLPVVPEVVAMIPVAGPVLAAAMKRSNMAEEMFTSGDGEQKKQWAKGQLRKDLKRLGVEEKYLEELVAVGFLLREKRGVVRELGKSEKPKDEKGPGAATREMTPAEKAARVRDTANTPKAKKKKGEGDDTGPLGVTEREMTPAEIAARDAEKARPDKRMPGDPQAPGEPEPSMPPPGGEQPPT
ncbi:MAG: hypothetical protein GY769_04345 [bacterium]|nr:hypothetical protein [bacterium]